MDDFLYDRGGGTRNTLVTLAMVVGTDIEYIVVFAVVPAYQLLVVAVVALLLFLFSRQAEVLFYLCKEPAARDDGMRFQQLFRGFCAHLRRDYACQVLFHVYLVDDDDAVLAGDEVKGSLEALVFLPLPVEIMTYSDCLQFEGRGGGGGLEEKFFV